MSGTDRAGGRKAEDRVEEEEEEQEEWQRDNPTIIRESFSGMNRSIYRSEGI